MMRSIGLCMAFCLMMTPLLGMAQETSPPVQELKSFLAKPADQRGDLAEQPFAQAALTKQEADAARQLLIADWRERSKQERAAELATGEINIGERTMPIFYKKFGEKPAGGRSLFISMHGGGNAPPEVNDKQWQNQQGLYEPTEGVYVAPRAPTDTWNLWHEGHIDGLFERLIEDMILVEEVDPNRVYIMGYSAGGDGVYQLAPRMADQLAAAAMMAGHPNETSPLGLRNIGFTLHMGELDGAYDRNKIAGEWRDKLAELHNADPQGYRHHVEIHPGKGHWMEREDAKAVEWMSEFTREPFPKRVVWKQDDVTHPRYYWLAVAPEDAKERTELRAGIDGQVIRLQSSDVPAVIVRVSDEMVDLDEPVRIVVGERTAFEGKIPRTIGMMARSLAERGDPGMVFFGEQRVELED